MAKFSFIVKKETPPLINLRSDNLQELAKKESFQRHLREMTDTPVIVAGDFNEPSHLDWIESTRDQHCGQIAPYNTSLQMYQWGFTDAFRFIKPDPIAFPGITWSVTDKMGDGLFYPSNLPEPQDRIDYIYYGRGEKLRCTGSFKLPNKGVNNPKPNYFLNDWPSDHFAVIADFDLAE